MVEGARRSLKERRAETARSSTGKLSPAAEATRERIVRTAEAVIRKSGFAGLQARGVAQAAEVAPGTLYYHFGDMDDLAAAVNSLTLARLDRLVSDVAPKGAEPSPRDVLVGLATAYHRFARRNLNLWSALFERGMAERAKPTTPDHVEEHMRLMVPIAVAVGTLFPDEDREACRRHASMLLSAIHGIVSMSIEGRMLGVAKGDVDDEIRFLLDGFCAGAPGSAKGGRQASYARSGTPDS